MPRRWRRSFFKTEGLYQNLLRDNVVVNSVAVRLLWCLRGTVVLKGTFAPVADKPDFVRAKFQRPRLCFKFAGQCPGRSPARLGRGLSHCLVPPVGP